MNAVVELNSNSNREILVGPGPDPVGPTAHPVWKVIDRVEVARIRRDVPDPWQLRVVLLNGESRVFRAETLTAAADEAKEWLA